MDRYPRSNGSIVERANSGIQAYMAQVYGWMTCGLLLTAVVAWYAANTPAVMNFIFSSQITFFGLIIVQLGLVFVISGMVNRLSGSMATSLFMLYSALTGLTLSSILIMYTGASIASTFIICAGMFGAMSVYGYTTKRDLSGMGSMLFMGLIGIVLFIGIFFYQIPFAGSLALFYGTMLLYGLSLVGFGLLISSLCSTQQQAFIGVFVFMMPAILLSGYVSPVENMPIWLQNITWINPIRHFTDITKQIYLKDASFDIIWHSLWPLLVITATTGSVAYGMFRRKIA